MLLPDHMNGGCVVPAQCSLTTSVNLPDCYCRECFSLDCCDYVSMKDYYDNRDNRLLALRLLTRTYLIIPHGRDRGDFGSWRGAVSVV